MKRRFAGAAAALGWLALGTQLFLFLRLALTNGGSLIGGLITYFSFFTILTNILAALALSLPLVRPEARAARFFSRPAVSSGVAANMAMVGITYSLLLRHLWQPRGMQFVVDVLLHDVLPILFLVYWWMFVPKGRLRWADVFRWALYPVLYLLYALVRGALSGRYPYPFIDAGQLGYGRVIVNAAAMLIGFVAVALLLVALGRWKDPASGQVGADSS